MAFVIIIVSTLVKDRLSSPMRSLTPEQWPFLLRMAQRNRRKPEVMARCVRSLENSEVLLTYDLSVAGTLIIIWS